MILWRFGRAFLFLVVVVVVVAVVVVVVVITSSIGVFAHISIDFDEQIHQQKRFFKQTQPVKIKVEPFFKLHLLLIFFSLLFPGFHKTSLRIHGTRSRDEFTENMNVVDFYGTSGSYTFKVFPVWISEKYIGFYPSPRMFSSK